MVWSQNFRNWPAKTCANRMLGLADPEHIDASDRLAAKKTDDSYECKKVV